MMATGQSDPPSDPQLTWDQHGSNFQMDLTRRQSPNLGTWTSYIILPDAIATAFLGYSTIATCLDPITPAKAAVSHLSHSAQDDRARYEKEARGIKLCGERERERWPVWRFKIRYLAIVQFWGYLSRLRFSGFKNLRFEICWVAYSRLQTCMNEIVMHMHNARLMRPVPQLKMIQDIDR